MGMAAVIYKKGAPANFVWEEIKVGSPGHGQVRLRSTAVGVNFADTYHRGGIAHPMIVGDPPVVVGFEGVCEIEESGAGVTGLSVGECPAPTRECAEEPMVCMTLRWRRQSRANPSLQNWPGIGW